jgi:uncharacterized protein YdaU (DUF1376 family)
MAREKEDKPLWMPMYWPSYLADTRHLSAQQHGAYLLLIAAYWTKGRLPTDEKQLARIALLTDAEWQAERPILSEFFEPGWKHKRVEKELAHARRIITRQRNNALSGWGKRRAQGTIIPFPQKDDDDAMA